MKIFNHILLFKMIPALGIMLMLFITPTSYSQIIPASPPDTINTNQGQRTLNGFWLHNKVKEIHLQRIGPFIQLPKGKIMTIDTLNAYISSNDGKTWQAIPIFSDVSKFQIRPERALIRTRKGTIILAFANDKERTTFNWSKETHDAPGAELPTYTVRSEDNGKTWSQPQKLHSEWTGAIRDIIETQDGQVVFSTMMLMHNPGHHSVLTYSSPDEGKTWKRSNIIDLGGVGDHDGVTESTLEQLKDGSLKMFMRTNWGFLWETTSSDNGITWKDIRSTKMDASSSPAMFKRLKSGRLIMIWNRNYPQGKNTYPLRGGDNNFSSVPVSLQREEISIMFSKDEGKSWSQPVVVAKTTKPRTQISYPYFFERKPGEIWLSFAFSDFRISLRERDFIK